MATVFRCGAFGHVARVLLRSNRDETGSWALVQFDQREGARIAGASQVGSGCAGILASRRTNGRSDVLDECGGLLE